MAAWASHPKPTQVDASLDDKINRTAVDAARRKFTPEFMNRIDKAVVFQTLRPEHLEQILEIELGMVQQRILMASAANQFVFNCTAKVKSFLLHEGTDPKYGARHLKRAIERNLVFPLANLVATGQVKLGDFIRVDLNAEGQLTFVKEAEGAMVPMLLERYGTPRRECSPGRPHLETDSHPPRIWHHPRGRYEIDFLNPEPSSGAGPPGAFFLWGLEASGKAASGGRGPAKKLGVRTALTALLQLGEHLAGDFLQRFKDAGALKRHRFDDRLIFPAKLFD